MIMSFAFAFDFEFEFNFDFKFEFDFDLSNLKADQTLKAINDLNTVVVCFQSNLGKKIL